MSDRFSEMPIFQEAHAFVPEIYSITRKFPQDEKFSLTNQLRRSAASIPANIIEGNARDYTFYFLL